LERATASSRITVDVLLDRIAGGDSSNGDWTGARRFQITPDENTNLMTSAQLTSSRAATDLGELDLGDPTVLKQFIASSMATYPAAKYLLFVNGVGAGWRGVSFDQTSGNRIDTVELHAALGAGTKLDVVAFDAGRMAMLEVAYELRDRMTYLVGSQAARAPAGYPYFTILQAMVDQPSVSAAAVAEGIVDLTVDAYTGQFEVTQSAIRVADLAQTDNALDDVAEHLQTLEATRHDEIAAIRAAAQRYGTGAFEGYVDLVDLINRLTGGLQDGTMTVRGLELLSQVNGALVAERHTGGSLALSHGLSLYFPGRAEYLDSGAGGEPVSQAPYAAVDLSSDTHWEDYLDDFTGHQPAP